MGRDIKKHYKGKYVCKQLKKIRELVAKEIGGDFDATPCSYEGDCLGTCPKCDAELSKLTDLLYKKLEDGTLSEKKFNSLKEKIDKVVDFVTREYVFIEPKAKAGLIAYDDFEDEKPPRVLRGKVVRTNDYHKSKNVVRKDCSDDDLFKLPIDDFYAVIDEGIRDKNGDIVYSKNAYELAQKYNELYLSNNTSLSESEQNKIDEYSAALRRSMLFGKDGEPENGFDI